jgi:hypothetical protein
MLCYNGVGPTVATRMTESWVIRVRNLIDIAYNSHVKLAARLIS